MSQCTMLQCVAVCCSVLQCVAVCCSVLQCVDTGLFLTCFTYRKQTHGITLQHTATHCNTLQHLRHTATLAPHCNTCATLQHLRYTATLCILDMLDTFHTLIHISRTSLFIYHRPCSSSTALIEFLHVSHVFD